MKPITYQDAVKMHKDKFGVEPVVTGMRFFDSSTTLERVLKAIESGKPYVEQQVPKGAIV